MDFVNTILQGDALTTLKTFPSESIDCCITSPPYWGLRDYGVEGQLGLEPDFRDYITKLTDIFDEVKRVLKPEGTCWVNLGDTYAGGIPGQGGTAKSGLNAKRNADGSLSIHRKAQPTFTNASRVKFDYGVKDKSLVQIPARFAIAMTDRGWILRNEVIWHKPNCMPSSVKDRFTVDFEKLFFFTKSKTYYFDQQKQELAASSVAARDSRLTQTKHVGASRSAVNVQLERRGERFVPQDGRNMRAVWSICPTPFKGAHFAVFPEELVSTPVKAGCPPFGIVLDPFMGAGTTAIVARKLVRHYVGIELNPEYIEIANRRLGQQVLQIA